MSDEEAADLKAKVAALEAALKIERDFTKSMGEQLAYARDWMESVGCPNPRALPDVEEEMQAVTIKAEDDQDREMLKSLGYSAKEIRKGITVWPMHEHYQILLRYEERKPCTLFSTGPDDPYGEKRILVGGSADGQFAWMNKYQHEFYVSRIEVPAAVVLEPDEAQELVPPAKERYNLLAFAGRQEARTHLFLELVPVMALEGMTYSEVLATLIWSHHESS